MYAEPQPPAVLFVDDEVMALKYFVRAVGGELDVLTAQDAESARRVLAEHGERLAVLISDQRMPGGSGVELLAHAREHYPHIVRLITTAYADIDEAVAAVNRGEVLRYISKPWDLEQLRMELRHAMDYAMLRRERDRLHRDKLSVWQRLVQANRLRDLVVFAGGLAHLRHSTEAVAALLTELCDAAPGRSVLSDWHHLELWGLLEQEIERMRAIAAEVAERCPADLALQAHEPVALDSLLRDVAVRAELEALLPRDLPTLSGQRRLLENLLQAVLETQRQAQGLHADIEGERVIVRIVGTVEGWSEGFYAAPGTREHWPREGALLSACLLAGHHGGSLSHEPDAVRLELPLTPCPLPALPSYWLEDLLVRCEAEA